MSIEEQFKTEILKQYRSIRAFTQAIDIPYSTIDTMLKKGIGGTSIQTVIKVCNALNIDVESVSSGILTYKKIAPETTMESEAKVQARAMKLYQELLATGFIEQGQDLTDAQIECLSGIVAILSAVFHQKD